MYNGSSWGEKMRQVNVEKEAIKKGFEIYQQDFLRDDNVGYIYDGKNKVITIPSSEYLDDYEQRFYLAKALAYYENAEANGDYFQRIEKGYSSEIDDKTIEMLVNDKKFMKYYKKYKGDVAKLSKLFKIPKEAVVEKTSTLEEQSNKTI